MKKNGFTLIELITVVALLSIIGIIMIPKISTAFKTTNADQLENLRENLSLSADVFLESTCGKNYSDQFKEEKYIKIYLSNLVSCGLIDNNVYNPTNGEYFDVSNEYIEITMNDIGLKNYHFSF